MMKQQDRISLCKKDFTMIDFEEWDRNSRSEVLDSIQSTNKGWKKLLTALREWILEYESQDSGEENYEYPREFLIRQIRLFHKESIYIQKMLKEAITGYEMFEMIKEFQEEFPQFLDVEFFSSDQIQILERIRGIKEDF